MSHRRIALGVASTGIALAFVVLVRLFKRGKKKGKPDGNVVRKIKAASRQGTRSPTGQAGSGKTSRATPQQSASAGPVTAALARAGSGQPGTVKRRVKPRSPQPAAAGSAPATGSAQRPSSRSQTPINTAAGAAAIKRAGSRRPPAAGQEAAVHPQATATPGTAGQKPATERTDTMASSSTSSPGTKTSLQGSVLQETSLAPVASPAKEKTDAAVPKGIVAAIAAEVQSSETASSAVTQGVSQAAADGDATPAANPALAAIDAVEHLPAPSAALVEAPAAAAAAEARAPEAAEAAEAVPNRAAVTATTVQESEPAAAPVLPDANGAQPACAAEPAAAVTVGLPESAPALVEATQPPAVPAAAQSSQGTAASAAVCPAVVVLPDKANAAGAEPVPAPPAAEAADTPSKRAAVSDTPTKSAAAAAAASTPGKAGGSTPSRVTMSPAVEAAEEQRSRSKQRLTVADVIRESIKLKQKNERLRQQLNLKSERRSRSSGTSSSSLSSRSNGASSSSSSVAPAAAVAAPDAAAADIPSQQGHDQAGNESTAAAVVAAEKSSGATELEAQAVASSSQPVIHHQAGGADAAVAGGGASSDVPRSSSNGNGASSSGGTRSDRGRDSRGPSLSAADLVREMAGIKAENMELVKLLAAQLAEVRQQNAELMAAFHRREQLAAVREEGEGDRSSRDTGQAGAGLAATEGGSTPNTGSELGTFKDRLRLPGIGRAPGSAAGSDAGSSLRSAPAGVGGSTPSRGLWKWATGSRRAGGAMTADNVSLPDSMASPRSNISVPVETLVDLLDWAAR